MGRILLISNDKRNRKLWTRWLSETANPRIQVLAAGSDDEALTYCEQQLPDGILLDAHLPGESAREVLRVLRDAPTAPPIVLLAGAEDEVLIETLEPYLDDVLAREHLSAPQVQRTAARLIRLHRLTQERDQAALARQRLEDELERMRQAREAFLAQKSHDLRSPLNAVIGYSELLLEKLASHGGNDLAGDVEKIREVSRRVLGVVADMTREPELELPGTPQDRAELSSVPVEDVPASTPVDNAAAILIIDDDAELRDLMERFLEVEGYSVETASNGQEGLQMARQLRPAAITLDLHMPGLDGWGVLKALKEDPELARTPVIMLTGRGNERVAARALQRGVDDYLIKGDISALTLRRAVQSALDKHRLQRDVEAAQQALVEANNALRQSERRYRLLAEYASDMISRHTPEGVYRYVSPASRTLMGYEPEDLLGRSAYEFFHPDDIPTIQQHHGQTLPDTTLADGISYRLRRKDGSYQWVETRSQRIKGEEDEIISVTRDISERKKAQDTLEELNETLEDRVEVQTRQIRALASSLTLAEQGERQRIAQILHDDLQQHLYSLNMRLQMLARKANAASQAAWLEGLAQMERMIGEAIRMTRTLSVELSPPALQNASLKAVMEWLGLYMQELHGLTVEIESGDPCDVPRREMRVLLFQLVRELLFNIVKHAGVDRARIILEHNDEHLRLEVVDQGKGFDTDALRHTPRAKGGWGLGTMEERLSLFNGTLKIASSPDSGTHMTITVPCVALEEYPSQVQHQTSFTQEAKP